MTHFTEADAFAVEPAVRSPNSDESNPMYGSEVSALAPRQDMWAADVLAGGPPQDRRAAPAEFTAGDSEKGLGGMANPDEQGQHNSTPGYNRGLSIGI